MPKLSHACDDVFRAWHYDASKGYPVDVKPCEFPASPHEPPHRGADPSDGVKTVIWLVHVHLFRRALQAYSPYTHCPAGMALVTAAGEVHWGPYLESAAFNPSLGPLQSALTAAVRAGLPSYDQVGQLSLQPVGRFKRVSLA